MPLFYGRRGKRVVGCVVVAVAGVVSLLMEAPLACCRCVTFRTIRRVLCVVVHVSLAVHVSLHVNRFFFFLAFCC